jgi:Rps23 Pro-64 3,4-dihydroxylase Tpa1-like proline 4-hydroxylase
MDIREFKEPRTHVVIKDFLTKDEQEKIWQEIKENESKFTAGLYTKDGKDEVHNDIKKNLGFDVTEAYPSMPDSLIRSLFYYKIFSDPKMQEIFSTAKSPIYSLLRFTNTDRTKVSAYQNEDFYEWHTDSTAQGLLTVLYMMNKEPKKFTGGDFMIKWDGIEKSIPFENNTILIFPRDTPHKVKKIKMESDDFYDKRFTIQCFANFSF